MAVSPPSISWSFVHVFLAVAEEGSLSAAARALGASQPTVGRQIRAMEEQLGAELFHRQERGFTLTALGLALLPSAHAMRDAAHEFQLRAAGGTEALAGTVRIASSIAVALFHLPAIIAELRVEQPHVGVELVPSDETSNLHFREADIAIRMYRPTQLDLVTQYLGEISLGAFVSREYAERRGIPRCAEELVNHEVIGMDRNQRIVDGFRDSGLMVDREWFKVRTDDQAAYWALVRAGCGIGFAHAVVGRRDPALVEIPMDLALPKLKIWLTAHEAIRRIPRVRRVWDLLAHRLRQVVDLQP